MRSILLVFLITLGFVQSASADIIFTLEQATPGDIFLGNSVVFNLYVRSDAGVVNNVAGIDALIDAADPGLSSVETVGGQFVAGGHGVIFSNADPFQIPFPTSLAVFLGTTNSTVSIETTDQLLATVTLSTVGATEGTYVMGLSGLSVVDPQGNTIPFSAQSTTSVSYTISAVPEPASLSVMGLVLAGAAWSRRSKKLA